MKNIISKNVKTIAAFILGMFISGITVSAITLNFASGDVAHTNADGSKTTVSAAINDLYSKAASGDATSAQILYGKKALSNGTLLTGTMSDYSTSTAQSCTTSNTSSKLYIKPSNAGYYTSSSSFNTDIAYNPNKTVVSSTSSASATANGNTTASSIALGKDQKVTIPAGYYSTDTVVESVATRSVGILVTFRLSTWGYDVPTATTQTELIIVPNSNGYGVRAYNTAVSSSGLRGGSQFTVSSTARVSSISVTSNLIINFTLTATGIETGTANVAVTLTVTKTSSGYTVSANRTSAFSQGVRGAEALAVTANAQISNFTATEL